MAEELSELKEIRTQAESVARTFDLADADSWTEIEVGGVLYDVNTFDKLLTTKR